MITDIHEKIKEKIRNDINQANSSNIIADFMSYSLPYRFESDEEAENRYAGNNPWSRIAAKIKENPDILKSQDMAYVISASFRSSTQIYAKDEFCFAMDIMEKLKVLKDDGIISETLFQEVLGLRSPETGETLLTKIMKDALNLERGIGNIQMFKRLLEVGIDVNIPNIRNQYPVQIIQHFHNIRKRNIEYSLEKGLVRQNFINEDYTFPKEKHIVEEKTTKETIENIKSRQVNKEEPKAKYKKTRKIRAYVAEGNQDVSIWQEGGPQGYAYAINVIEPTYLSEDIWGVHTIILPGKYIVYEGRGEELQVIEIEKFYNNYAHLYLIEGQGKKLKAVENKDVLKTLAGNHSEKTLATPIISKKKNNIAKKIDETINKNLDMNNIKNRLKQLENASDQLFKKITKLLKKKS